MCVDSLAHGHLTYTNTWNRQTKNFIKILIRKEWGRKRHFHGEKEKKQISVITSIDDLNWIGAFLYVDDMVLMARSPSQLQSMIDACQDWAERSRMRINHKKTEVMKFERAQVSFGVCKQR